MFFLNNGRDASSFAKASADRSAGILAWAALLGEASAKGGLSTEALAKAEKMSTFVSGKKLFISRLYAEFMSTFVYPPQKEVSGQIKYLAQKNVYFCILLTTFHGGRGAVSC